MVAVQFRFTPIEEGLEFEEEQATGDGEDRRAITRAGATLQIIADARLPDGGFAVTPANVAALAAAIRAARPAVTDGRKPAVKLLLRAQGVDLASGAGQSLLSREWVRIRDMGAVPTEAATSSRHSSRMPDTRLLRFQWLPVLPKFLLTVLPTKVRDLQLRPEHAATALSVGPHLARFADEVVASFEPEFVAAIRSAAASHLGDVADAKVISQNRPRVPVPPVAPLLLEDLDLPPLYLGEVPEAFSVADVVAIGGQALVVRGRSGWLTLQLGLAVECAALARIYGSMTIAVGVPSEAVASSSRGPGWQLPDPTDLPLVPAAFAAASEGRIWEVLGLEVVDHLASLGVRADPDLPTLTLRRLEGGSAPDVATAVAGALRRAMAALGPEIARRAWDARPRDVPEVPIRDVPLSRRARRILRSNGCRTFADAGAIERRSIHGHGLGVLTTAEVLGWMEALAALPARDPEVAAEPDLVVARRRNAASAMPVEPRPSRRPVIADSDLRRAWRRYHKILPRIRANDVRFNRRSSRLPLDKLASGGRMLDPGVAGALRTLQRLGLSLGPTPSAEVASALRRVLEERQARVLISRLGFEDGGVQTLEEVARAMQPAVTRERVRQIETKALKTARSYSAYLPLCTAAVRALRRLGGTATEDDLRAAMGTAGRLASPADLRAITAAATLGWGPKVAEDSGYWSLTADGLARVRSIREAIREAARTEFGAAFSLGEVAEQLAAAGTRADMSLFRGVARQFPDLVDLGDDIFARHPGKDTVGRALSKIMQTAGPISEGPLTRAFLRDPRLKRIPREVIALELRNNPVFVDEGGKWSVSGSVPPIALRESENVALRILRANGAMTGPELLQQLKQDGIGDASARVVVSQSSLIQKWPRNVYTRIGARPTAGEIADAVGRRADRRANRPKTPIHVAHLGDGSIKITTAYGAGLMSSGVLSVGSRVHLDGDWDGQADGAYRHRVRSANGLIWGISQWLNRMHVAEGEYVSLTFRPARRTVWLQREAAPERA